MTSLRWDEFIDVTSGDIKRLDYVWRFSSIPISVPENVSSHTFWVCFYSLMLHRKLMPDDTMLVGAILTHALIHDICESCSGDFVRTFKYSSEVLKEAIDNAEKNIIKEFHPMIRDLFSFASELSEGADEYVKQIIKAADFVSLYQFMNREINRGNLEIGPFVKRMKVDLEQMGKKIENHNDNNIRQLSHLYYLMSKMAFSKRAV